MSVILITGAGGMLGRMLKQRLIQSGNQVRILTTNTKNKDANATSFLWNVKDKYIQDGALDGVDIVVHLAGSNIGNQRWTRANKEDIIRSRAGSADLIRKTLEQNGSQISHFISGSGTGYYPDPGHKIYSENDKPGNGFLSEVCVAWEKSAMQFESENSKVTILRMAPVFSTSAGLLPTISKTKFLRILPVLGNGKNNWGWIHVQDAVSMFEFIIQNKLSGVFNAIAPGIATQKDVLKGIAGNKMMFYPKIPSFLLKLLLGERSALPLTNQMASPEKILEQGFTFEFSEIQSAMENLMHGR